MFWQFMTFLVSILGIIAACTLLNYPPPPPNTTVMYAPPPPNPYQIAVAGAGLVEAYQDNVYLGAEVQGVVKKVYVKVGDEVGANQLLLEVDDRLQKAQVEIAKTNVRISKAAYEKNVSQLTRLNAVKDSRSVSMEDLRNKEYDVKTSEQQIKNALAQLVDAEKALAQTKIYSPKAGMVLKMDFREGEFATNLPLSPDSANSAFIVIGRTDKLQVRCDIDEYNAFRIRANQQAVAYTKGVAQVPLPLTFERFEPYCVPKKSLTAAVDERVDTRVLQVIYSFDLVPDFPVYVGQQVDVFIDAPLLLHSPETKEAALKHGIDLKR